MNLFVFKANFVHQKTLKVKEPTPWINNDSTSFLLATVGKELFQYRFLQQLFFKDYESMSGWMR